MYRAALLSIGGASIVAAMAATSMVAGILLMVLGVVLTALAVQDWNPAWLAGPLLGAGVAVAGDFGLHQGANGFALGLLLIPWCWINNGWGKPRQWPGWKPWDGLVGIGLLLVVSGFLSIVSHRIGGPSPALGLPLLVLLYWLTPPFEIAIVGVLLRHARMFRQTVAGWYRLPRSLGVVVLEGLGVGLGLILISGWVVALQARLFRERVVPNNPFVMTPLGLAHHPVAAVLVALAAVVLAPIAEEALFRGILFGSWEQRYGYAPASIASALVFGGMHLNLSLLGGLTIAGLALNALYHRHHSLIPSTVAHATLNGVSILAAFLAHGKP